MVINQATLIGVTPLSEYFFKIPPQKFGRRRHLFWKRPFILIIFVNLSRFRRNLAKFNVNLVKFRL